MTSERWPFGYAVARAFAGVRPASFGFALAGLGHAIYVPGELDPATFSTLFDAITAGFLFAVAWVVRDVDELPRGVAWAFVAFAIVKAVDLLASLGDGLYPFHFGWIAIVPGAILLAWGAVRNVTGIFRSGAALNAFGSIVYVALGLMDLMTDGTTNAFFLVGALVAAAGWVTLAWRP